jgi:hypothetical protein
LRSFPPLSTFRLRSFSWNLSPCCAVSHSINSPMNMFHEKSIFRCCKKHSQILVGKLRCFFYIILMKKIHSASLLVIPVSVSSTNNRDTWNVW